MEKTNGEKIKVHERIATLEQCYKYIKDELDHIRGQVDNHLPSAINRVDNKLDEYISKSKTRSIITLISILMLLLGTIINILISK